MKNLINKSVLKKLSYIGLIIVVIAFFAIPSFIFADEGDATTWVGVREPEVNGGVYTGQYVMGDSADTGTDVEGDGDTEVLCIDGDHYVESGPNKYEDTGQNASDDLTNEIGATDALAVEIISKTATGASPTEDQVAVWELTDDAPAAVYNDLTNDQKNNVDTIVVAAKAIATLNTDNDTTNDVDIDKINSIEVTLDNKPLYDETIEDYSDHLATAIIEEPFVPGITDVSKFVYWYILADSYNVSFSETELVTEDTSTMTDKTDDANDIDGDGKVVNDHFGEATKSYYFFWWGGDYPQYEEMKVSIGAWADIDEDGKLDVVDPVGGVDAKGTIKNSLEFVVVDDNGTPGDTSDDIATIDDNGTSGDYTDDSVKTDKLTDTDFDIHLVEGGKVIKAISDRGEDGAGSNIVDQQRFITDAFDEPYDTDSKTYSSWGSFTVFKTNSSDGITPVPGAFYTLRYDSGQTKYIDTEYTLETEANGKDSVGNLPWGTYKLKEDSAPSGFYINPNEYTVLIGGKAFDGELVEAVIDASKNVTNDPVPPGPGPTPEPTPTPTPTPTPDGGGGTTTLTVAGLTTPGVIQVLAFTGMDPIIPIAGIGTVLIGFGLFIVSLKKRVAWKHVANK